MNNENVDKEMQEAFTMLEISILNLINQKLINVEVKDLQNYYNFWKKDFIKEYKKEDDNGFKQGKKELFKHISKYIKDEYYKKCIIGIDLPVLFKANDDNKTIVILAQDPLRGKDFVVDKIHIGTPFAIHSSEYRKGKTKLYCNQRLY